MLFNVKFHAGVNTLLLEDNNLLYYSFDHRDHQRKLTLDFSNLTAKVQSFALLREDLVYKEKEIAEEQDINHCEVEVGDLELGKYMMRITTIDSQEMTEEIEILE